MRRHVAAGLVVGLVATLSSAGCGNSEEDCGALCDWWMKSCTRESREECMSKCGDADAEDVSHAQEVCLALDASSCVGASCCLGFIYTDYYNEYYC